MYSGRMASNVAGEDSTGGAIYMSGFGTNAAIFDCYMQYNRAGEGGAVALYDFADVSITNSYVDDNTANANGGAFMAQEQGTIYLYGVQANYNYARASGGVVFLQSGGKLVAYGGRFFRNSATQGSAGDVVVNVTVGGVLAMEQGHVLPAYAVMRGCVFRENQADRGGVIHAMGNNHLHVQNSTFIDNNAMRDGGALYLVTRGNNIFKNCEFIVNQAFDGNGGAVVMEDPSAQASDENFEGFCFHLAFAWGDARGANSWVVRPKTPCFKCSKLPN